MWFNSMQREEPYLGLTFRENLTKVGLEACFRPEQVLHGCRQLVS